MQSRDNLAPVVLFVYNRPDHTRRTLEALAANALADASTLYMYADGPRLGASSVERKAIQSTRRVLRERKWCKQVHIIESDHNLGLADSIVKGVTEVVNKHGKVIVLEDDIITSQGFLQYMNDALSLYENEDKVMHVSGYMFPVKDKLSDTFFYNTASCWGWGTWKIAWQHYDHDAAHLARRVETQGKIRAFDVEDSYPFYQSLLANANGQKKTWAVRWYASFFLQDGLALHPYPSLTNNVGFDATGENCSTNDIYYWPTLAQNIETKLIPLKESTLVRVAMKAFYNTNLTPQKAPSLLQLVRKTKKLIPASVKHQVKIRTSKEYQRSYKDKLERHRLKSLPR